MIVAFFSFMLGLLWLIWIIAMTIAIFDTERNTKATAEALEKVLKEIKKQNV